MTTPTYDDLATDLDNANFQIDQLRSEFDDARRLIDQMKAELEDARAQHAELTRTPARRRRTAAA